MNESSATFCSFSGEVSFSIVNFKNLKEGSTSIRTSKNCSYMKVMRTLAKIVNKLSQNFRN
jgi:hypothetical protein